MRGWTFGAVLAACTGQPDTPMDGTASASAVASTARNGVGVLKVQADGRAVAPALRPRFTGCHADFDAPISQDQAASASTAFEDGLAKRRPTLVPLEVSARHVDDALIITSPDGERATFAIGKDERFVYTSLSLLRATEGKDAWNGTHPNLLNAILPLQAMVAFAGADDFRQQGEATGGARFYVVRGAVDEVARTLDAQGRELVRDFVCAHEEGYDRDEFRFESEKREQTRRVLLVGAFQRFGRIAFDFRILPLGRDRALVVACISEYWALAHCDALTAAWHR